MLGVWPCKYNTFHLQCHDPEFAKCLYKYNNLDIIL